ncbi:hypothetical protein NLO83_09180 [Pseudomonas tremae]|uniref:hypothetical protein n=1 Tax=Pseudomonas syringae group TaxID=136849 RepID=UPI0001AF5CD4|nr:MULTISPECIES: hypothetical protein [Pseudomonas syringae group]MCQ3015774.1 hypothetical protein [Pseudomonas tremae]QGL55726.1 hypothetical protein POR16_04945 [Pseudomonas coronafaciens pv. oryzae str. 1_6]RMM32585.1 hypothetical protein ALQ80_100179 [Pseudomonas coronafaciens pv. oryzae]
MYTRFCKAVVGMHLVAGIVLLAGCTQESVSPCDELIGDYATKPKSQPKIRIEKSDEKFLLTNSESGTQVSEALTPLPTAEIVEIFEGRIVPPRCILTADGIKIMKLPAGSGINPTEDPDRKLSHYPEPTPFLMGISAGVAAVLGLYPVPHQEKLKDIDEDDEEDDGYIYSK